MKELVFERPNVIIEKDENLKAIVVRLKGTLKVLNTRGYGKGAELVKDPTINFGFRTTLKPDTLY